MNKGWRPGSMPYLFSNLNQKFKFTDCEISLPALSFWDSSPCLSSCSCLHGICALKQPGPLHFFPAYTLTTPQTSPTWPRAIFWAPDHPRIVSLMSPCSLQLSEIYLSSPSDLGLAGLETGETTYCLLMPPLVFLKAISTTFKNRKRLSDSIVTSPRIWS